MIGSAETHAAPPLALLRRLTRQDYSFQAEEWKTDIQVHSPDQKKIYEHRYCDMQIHLQ